MGTKLLGFTLLGAALVLVVAALYLNSEKSSVPLVYSPSQILNATWLNYTANYLEATTSRTLDPTRGYVTTSEGESYTMLRAVYEGDKSTFDASWTWTKNNLAHKSGDHLFAWLFGKQSNGVYGVLASQGGEHSASDADTDIALSLLFAYARWQDHSYLGDARVILSDIWDKEVITINGKPYLVADDVEKTSPSEYAAIDPSYFNPAAYHIFAQFDNAHPWAELSQTSYDVIDKSAALALGKAKSAGLPPDWVAIDKSTGALVADPNAGATTFGYDALRVPFRVALDYAWFKDPRATSTLAKLSFLSQQWKQKGLLNSTYAHDGSVTVPEESAAMYGGTIGYFMLADSTDAADVYNKKLVYLFDPDINAWKEPLSYYDDNWAWFGIALYNNLLPNLTANLPADAFIQ